MNELEITLAYLYDLLGKKQELEELNDANNCNNLELSKEISAINKVIDMFENMKQ